MKRVGLLGLVLAFVTTAFAASTPAFAATQNLSGTVTTSITQTGTSFTDDVATNGANATGATNGSFLTLTHGSGNVAGFWTVNATIGGLTDIGVAYTFYIGGGSNMGVMNISQIVLTDSSGNTATISPSASLTATGAITVNTALSAYTINNVSGTFTKGNVNAISLVFGMAATGNKIFQLDAVDVIDTPEPSTIALFGLGLAGLGGGLLRRRRARRAAAARAAA